MSALLDHSISIAAALAVGGFTTLAIVASQHWHGQITLDSFEGAQKFHARPTPRVGGVGVFVGLITFWLLSPGPTELLGLAIAAGTLAFTAGLVEDLTKRVAVFARLAATSASGLVACLVTGTHLTAVHVPVVDSLLAWSWFAVPFTAIALAGVANAVNMIDGFNGLAGGTAIIVLLAMGTIAGFEGDAELLLMCLGIAASVAGFLIFNFPGGRIFLGDGGAYFVGFLIGWIAVLLVERNPSVSPWAGIVACGYPVSEMFFSMWRKHRRDGHHPSQPDRVHLHMLLYNRVVRHRFGPDRVVVGNSMTSPLLWLLALVPAVLAVCLRAHTLALIAGYAGFAMLYLILYRRLAFFRWVMPWSLPPSRS